MANNLFFHARTKHVDAQFHFIREKIQSKEIFIEYHNTCENVADIFTNPLGKMKFELFREILGVEFNPFSIRGKLRNNGERLFLLCSKIRFSSYFLGDCCDLPNKM